MELIDEAYERACVAIELCSSPHGLYASGGKKGYNSVWARDSMICLLGAALVKGDKFKNILKKTLETLSINQSERGQIPNCVDLFDKKRHKQVTFATLDSSLWYLIGQYYYAKAFKDNSLLKKYEKNIHAALKWVEYQDSGEDGLPEQQPTSDWEDCFPHKYGHVLNTQALYYGATLFMDKNTSSNIKKIVNGRKRSDMDFFDHKKGIYHPWIWKSHDGLREEESWFDSLANLLSIVFGLAEKGKAIRVIDYIKVNDVAKPFPIRAIHPPIENGSKEWKDYFGNCLAATPNVYINGGIWPYIGGFYVAALVAVGMHEEAKKELHLLALANKLGNHKMWEFNEWVHPITMEALGSDYHAWSAGAYIFAYHCVKEKKVPVFETKLE